MSETETISAATTAPPFTARAVGARAPDAPLEPLAIQRRAVGPKDVRIDFCAEHGTAAEIEVVSAAQVSEAWERVLASDVRYRFVIDNSTL